MLPKTVQDVFDHYEKKQITDRIYQSADPIKPGLGDLKCPVIVKDIDSIGRDGRI